MFELLEAVVWAAVVVFMIILGNRRAGDVMALKKPLSHTQYTELKAQLDSIQSQVNSISIQNSITDRG